MSKQTYQEGFEESFDNQMLFLNNVFRKSYDLTSGEKGLFNPSNNQYNCVGEQLHDTGNALNTSCTAIEKEHCCNIQCGLLVSSLFEEIKRLRAEISEVSQQKRNIEDKNVAIPNLNTNSTHPNIIFSAISKGYQERSFCESEGLPFLSIESNSPSTFINQKRKGFGWPTNEEMKQFLLNQNLKKYSGEKSNSPLLVKINFHLKNALHEDSPIFIFWIQLYSMAKAKKMTTLAESIISYILQWPQILKDEYNDIPSTVILENLKRSLLKIFHKIKRTAVIMKGIPY
jgi:hypothetical protein